MIQTPEDATSTYNAASIRILSEAEIIAKFEWAKLGHLAAQYKRDEAFVRKGIEACEHVGVDPEYFIQRYLAGDKTIPLREDVDAAFRELFLRAAERR